MKTKVQMAPTLTPEDELQIMRGARGLHFQIYRKRAGLSIAEVSSALAKEGYNITEDALSLFERGGTDKKNRYVADERRIKIDFAPDVLAELEELYKIPTGQRLEHSHFWSRFIAKAMSESLMQPILGKYKSGLTEENKLRAQVNALTFQLKREKELNKALMQTIERLQALIHGGSKSLLTGKPTPGWTMPTGTGEKVLGRGKK